MNTRKPYFIITVFICLILVFLWKYNSPSSYNDQWGEKLAYIQKEENIDNQHSFVPFVKDTTKPLQIKSPEGIGPPSFTFTTFEPNPLEIKEWILSDIINFKLIRNRLTQIQPSSKNVIDVGGNHGFYTFFCSGLGYHVDYFEIQSDLVNCVYNALPLNPSAENLVKIHNIGLSNKESELSIVGSRGTAYLTENPSSKQIHTTTLDRFFSEYSIFSPSQISFGISLLKIDVEGFEIAVLEGAKNLLASNSVGAMLIEIGPTRWSRSKITIDQGTSIMTQLVVPHFTDSHIIIRGGTCQEKLKEALSQPPINEDNVVPINQDEWTHLFKLMGKLDSDCNFWFVNENFH